MYQTGVAYQITLLVMLATSVVSFASVPALILLGTGSAADAILTILPYLIAVQCLISGVAAILQNKVLT